MRRLIETIVVLVFGVVAAHAWTTVNIANANGKSITSDVVLSTVTTSATKVLPARGNRLGWSIQANGYSVRLSTWAVTTWTGIDVSSGTTYTDAMPCYEGAIYAIGISTKATVNTNENFDAGY